MNNITAGPHNTNRRGQFRRCSWFCDDGLQPSYPKRRRKFIRLGVEKLCDEFVPECLCSRSNEILCRCVIWMLSLPAGSLPALPRKNQYALQLASPARCLCVCGHANFFFVGRPDG